jgi:transcriptional regulator with XRE-family HTH domain
MDLYERIKEVASAKGISINKLEKDLNLPRSSVRKYCKNKPSAERIGTIADYLGVSADYLINGNVDISEGVQTNVQAQEYYKDKKAAEAAQKVFSDPNYRILFDAADGSTPEDLLYAAEMLRRLKGN